MEAMPLIDSALSYSPATSSVMASIDEDEMTLEAKQCLSALKEGKRSVQCTSTVFCGHESQDAFTATGLECMAKPFCNAAVPSSLVADMSNASLGVLRRACSDVMAVRVQITEAGQRSISFGEV